jgi:cytosine/adenosine deaminase-related metal-dependent hydrolase
MHHTSSPERIAHAAQHGGLSPTAYLESLGVLGPNVLLAHVSGIDDSEVDCIARTDTGVAICPSNALKQAQGLGDRKLPELLDRGVNVALGSDSANSSNYLDMVRTINIAAVGFKDERRNLKLVPAEQALEMATLLGAQAVGLGDQIGSVEIGKKADLLLFDTRRAEWSALFNPLNNLVYNADGRSIHTVVADGRIVLEAGVPVFADEGKIADKVQELGEAFLTRVGAPYDLTRWPIV